jgi:hypothetical protein
MSPVVLAGRQQQKPKRKNKQQKNMKKILIVMAAAAGLAFSIGTSQAQLLLNDASNPQFSISGNQITIGSFVFNNDLNLTGSITPPGTGFDVTVPATALGGGIYESTISGVGTITLSDTAAGASLVGSVQLIQVISGTGINEPNFEVNVVWTAYTAGTGDADLAYLDSSTYAELGFSVTGIFYNSTSDMWYTSPSPTEFTGQISTVPEASTVMAGALMLLPLGIGAVRAIRKERTA